MATIRNQSNTIIEATEFQNQGKAYYVVDSTNIYFKGVFKWVINEDQQTFFDKDDTAFFAKFIRSSAVIDEIEVVGNGRMRKYTFVLAVIKNSNVQVKKITVRNLGDPDPTYQRNHDVVMTDATSNADVDEIDAEDVGDTCFDCKGRGSIGSIRAKNVFRVVRLWRNAVLRVGPGKPENCHHGAWFRDSSSILYRHRQLDLSLCQKEYDWEDEGMGDVQWFDTEIVQAPVAPMDSVPVVPAPVLVVPAPVAPVTATDYEYKWVIDSSGEIENAKKEGWALADPIHYRKSTIVYETRMKRERQGA